MLARDRSASAHWRRVMEVIEQPAARVIQGDARLRELLGVLGLTQLALGAVMAIAPGAFFDSIADYGVRNDHYVRDISTLYLALGAALVLAAGRPSWRAPVLAFAAIQYGLHAVNHLVDVGDADPGWLGPFNLAALLAFEAVLLYALRAVTGAER
jgi:hypothetical protein